MIFVDTSVWIRAFRSKRSSEAAHLTELLDADEVALSIVARIEILSGATAMNRDALIRALSALPVFRSSERTWDRVESWVETAADKGARFGVPDLLVAAIAAEQRSAVWSVDKAFDRMEELGFVALHQGPDR